MGSRFVRALRQRCWLRQKKSQCLGTDKALALTRRTIPKMRQMTRTTTPTLRPHWPPRWPPVSCRRWAPRSTTRGFANAVVSSPRAGATTATSVSFATSSTTSGSGRKRKRVRSGRSRRAVQRLVRQSLRRAMRLSRFQWLSRRPHQSPREGRSRSPTSHRLRLRPHFRMSRLRVCRTSGRIDRGAYGSRTITRALLSTCPWPPACCNLRVSRLGTARSTSTADLRILRLLLIPSPTIRRTRRLAMLRPATHRRAHHRPMVVRPCLLPLELVEEEWPCRRPGKLKARQV
mmetsp:Transcript_58288/g.162485  ORF Transcript_58288/g.162485 Transcript_58288/m.162485 type:complete len:289 (+) Transcript_58288:449-1315(+)